MSTAAPGVSEGGAVHLPTANTPTIIDELRQKTKEYTVEAACGRQYVRAEALTAWMRTELHRLMDHVYKDDYRVPFEAVDINGQYSGKYLLVWAILLNIETGDYGKHIQSFRTHSIDDRRIPVNLTDLRGVLERNHSDNTVSADPLCKEFMKHQWKYCPIKFERNMNTDCLEQEILPICKKKPIKAGGTAEVWQIAVQEEFVGVRLREALRGNNHASYHDEKYGKVCSYLHQTPRV